MFEAAPAKWEANSKRLRPRLAAKHGRQSVTWFGANLSLRHDFARIASTDISASVAGL
jgi:hypothetical protein